MHDDGTDQTNSKIKKITRPLGNLLIWLMLVPIVFGTLICFSELALVIHLEEMAANTQSMLEAAYQPWPYDEIPPINIAAFFSDIQREIALFGTPVSTTAVEIGAVWVPPTPAGGDVDQGTITPPDITVTTPTPTIPDTANTPTNIVPSPTSNPSTPTRAPGFTLTPTIITSTPTPTIWVVTLTYTPEPSTPKPTNTVTPIKTIAPTAVNTIETVLPTTMPTPTTEPSLPPVYFPVRPIAENNGASSVDPGGQGCLGYFGYRNDNPVEVDVPLGERNYLSGAPVSLSPGGDPPTHFYTDRVSPAFEVVWSDPVPITWYLEGRSAVLQWCNP
jgi:hypothetical protein